MTPEQILKKAIRKAEKNGFNLRDYLPFCCVDPEENPLEFLAVYPEVIIFEHDFAKAFWGEEVKRIGNGYGSVVEYLPEWKWHLQQMVLEKEPLKYLEKFLEEK